MTTRTITVTLRDGTTKSVESHYTDDEALERLAHLVSGYADGGHGHRLERSEFACDLVRKGRQHGLSEKQAAWVHILVVEADTPREERAPVATLPRVRALIDKAAETLKFPKVNFTLEDGSRLRLSRAGARSRTPGVINLTDGRPYGENVWYGKVDLDGNLHAGRSMTDEVLRFLSEFDADPAACATAYGHRTGACCFCSRELTDSRSVAVGYGPVCAGKYGLPWGDERVASSAVHAHEEARAAARLALRAGGGEENITNPKETN